ncbi:Bug family tripartite tricarboxylate transporter substrate binding protein [Roseomonas populi]|uniref:Tripartite tricarboxylate transporter substrate binding protein n=1 Tax=Roseomonas populi TaxID=3121582 RepID=A0ABT1XBF1_9PROT|nr:tripartite tricarboxylate transporter substrate binding protein [Roseomonas pecuniae]MCR0985462.1 tripartite tricarboxylate transporter substrate binding protein [Roseomonas pecuniae]
MHRRTMLAASLGALAGAVPLGRAEAQAFPSRPVRIIVPYAAGQGSDLFARRFAEHFQRQLGQPFVVENRPGAGGNIGSAATARAEPDGHTLLWGTNGTHAGNEFMYANLGFDPVRDFEPVAGILRFGMMLGVAQNGVLRTVPDLIRAAKERPGQVSVGLPSTTARAVLQMIRDKTGADLLPVPYTGSAQALTGLLRGDVQASIDTVTAVLGPIRQGQMAPVAISTESRSESLGNVPTLKELGVDATLEAWNALYAPRGTPAAAVAVLNRVANTALADPAIRAMLVHDGADPLGGRPEDLAALMRRDRAIWEPIVRSLGLAPQ